MQNAPCMWGRIRDFKNPIGRTFLSGNCILAETGKSRRSVRLRLDGWSFTKEYFYARENESSQILQSE
jgi:hypothetical protein